MRGAWVGYVGLVAFALAWIPQSLDTIRAGRCEVNRTFLALAGVGSLSLTIYALQQGDPVFATLNALTTLGAFINLCYSLFPRRV
ncbi:MAG: lipid-A-disaccharide synthase N-terminal domain-containing protein [Elusimicrobia bacterium]|nr:lipid-A-disaccharide synthase N-terminal domain-containing protein [Elusimicrobiota bacterium]